MSNDMNYKQSQKVNNELSKWYICVNVWRAIRDKNDVIIVFQQSHLSKNLLFSQMWAIYNYKGYIINKASLLKVIGV